MYKIYFSTSNIQAFVEERHYKDYSPMPSMGLVLSQVLHGTLCLIWPQHVLYGISVPDQLSFSLQWTMSILHSEIVFHLALLAHYTLFSEELFLYKCFKDYMCLIVATNKQTNKHEALKYFSIKRQGWTAQLPKSPDVEGIICLRFLILKWFRTSLSFPRSLHAFDWSISLTEDRTWNPREQGLHEALENYKDIRDNGMMGWKFFGDLQSHLQ